MIRDVLLGAVLPGAVALVVMLIAWPPRRAGTVTTRRGHWGGAVAFAVAPIVSLVGLAGLPTWPPAERWQWIVVLAAACGAVAAACAPWRRPAWLSLIAGPVSAGLCLLLMKPPGSPEHAWLGLPILAVATIALWAGLEPLARRNPGASLPAILLIAFAGAAAVIVGSRNATIGLLAASCSAAAGAALAAAWLHRGLSLAHGAVPVVAAVGVSLLFLGAWYDYGSVPVGAFLLAAAAPLAAWGGELPVVRRRSPLVAALVRVALVAIAAAVAVLMAMTAGEADPYG